MIDKNKFQKSISTIIDELIDEQLDIATQATDGDIDVLSRAMLVGQFSYFTKLIKRLTPFIHLSNQWISVKDRLPEKYGYYLVVTRNHKIEILRFDGNIGQVEYWMPLPSLPKDKE